MQRIGASLESEVPRENLISRRPMKATTSAGTRRRNQRFSLLGFFQGVIMRIAIVDHRALAKDLILSIQIEFVALFGRAGGESGTLIPQREPALPMLTSMQYFDTAPSQRPCRTARILAIRCIDVVRVEFKMKICDTPFSIMILIQMHK